MVKVEFTDEYQKILWQISLFKDMDNSLQRRLPQELELSVYEVARKEIVLKQDTYCNHLYVLLKGAETRDERERRAAMVVEQVSQAVNADTADEGIARLASSVHSGRTGRYGEAFAPVETTLTWGRGLKLDEYEASLAAGRPEQEAAAAAEQAAVVVAGPVDAADGPVDGGVDAAAGASDDAGAMAADTPVPDIDLSPAAVSATLSASGEASGADGDVNDAGDGHDKHDMPAAHGTAGPVPVAPPAPPVPPMPPAPPAPRVGDSREGTDDTKGDARR